MHRTRRRRVCSFNVVSFEYPWQPLNCYYLLHRTLDRKLNIVITLLFLSLGQKCNETFLFRILFSIDLTKNIQGIPLKKRLFLNFWKNIPHLFFLISLS